MKLGKSILENIQNNSQNKLKIHTKLFNGLGLNRHSCQYMWGLPGPDQPPHEELISTLVKAKKQQNTGKYIFGPSHYTNVPHNLITYLKNIQTSTIPQHTLIIISCLDHTLGKHIFIIHLEYSYHTN
jgi:hypothetical protein